jgi:predicted nucleic acid-binding protein
VSVCLDASFVLLWFLREELSARADALLAEWRRSGGEFIAPALLLAEVPSVLRHAVHLGRINVREGDESFAAFRDWRIRILEPDRFLDRAWQVGKALNAPRLYDMHYVALAELEGCELWTADRRLANLAAPHAPFVRWVGDVPEVPSHA